MNASAKRLVLNRETIRVIANLELSGIQGGIGPVYEPGPQLTQARSDCACTNGCELTYYSACGCHTYD